MVISTLGPRLPTKAAISIYSDSATSIVDTMQGSGVNRLLVTSSALLFPSDRLLDRVLRRLTPNGRPGGGPHGRADPVLEPRLDDLPNGFLTNDGATGYRHAEGVLPEGGGSISRAAVACFLLAEARQSAQVRQVVGLCG